MASIIYEYRGNVFPAQTASVILPQGLNKITGHFALPSPLGANLAQAAVDRPLSFQFSDGFTTISEADTEYSLRSFVFSTIHG